MIGKTKTRKEKGEGYRGFDTFEAILYNEKNKFDYSDKFLKASKDKRGETYQAGLEFHSNASVFYTTIVLKQGSS